MSVEESSQRAARAARKDAGLRFPERLRGLPDYPLAGVSRTRERLRAEGVRVIDLGAGDPGLPVPEQAVEALRRAAGSDDMHGYAFQRGLPEYRRAAADYMEDRFGARPDPETELLPLIGSKEGIAHFAFAALGPGDRALVPDPGYAPYFGGSYLAGAEIERAELRPENGFLVPPSRIRAAGENLRLVYLNYPNNPTAACADRSYLQAVVDACRERGARLLYDHAYCEICYEGYCPPGLLEVTGGTEVGLEFHSLSKTFNMTGWRLGWAVGGEESIRALSRVKTYFDTGAFLPVQAAGAAALRAVDDFLPENLRRLRRRRDAAVEAFRAAGFDVDPPRATLYLWMPVPTGESSGPLARRLLERTGVVLMPGSAMGEGGEGYLRAALTASPADLREAGERVAATL